MLRTALLTVLVALAAAALALASADHRHPSRPSHPGVERHPRARAVVAEAAPLPRAEGERRRPAAPAPTEAVAPQPPDDVRVLSRVVHGETGETLDVPVEVAWKGPRSLALSLDPPPGLVPASTSSAEHHATLAPHTHTVHATFVLVPAVRVLVRPDAHFRGRVRKATLRLGDRPIESRGRRPQLFVVPRHAGAPLHATLETVEDSGHAGTTIPAGAERVTIEIPHPDTLSPGGSLWGCSSPSSPALAPFGEGRLEVLVRDRAGRPERGAVVRLEAWTSDERYESRRGTTDADGVVELTELAATRGTLTVTPRRGVPSVVDVRLDPTGATTVHVDEPPATTVVVEVIDAAGRPVPFARLTPRFEREDLVLVDRGERVLAHLTDVGGMCTLRGVPPRGLEITARWGGVRAWAKVTAPGRMRATLPVTVER